MFKNILVVAIIVNNLIIDTYGSTPIAVAASAGAMASQRHSARATWIRCTTSCASTQRNRKRCPEGCSHAVRRYFCSRPIKLESTGRRRSPGHSAGFIAILYSIRACRWSRNGRAADAGRPGAAASSCPKRRDGGAGDDGPSSCPKLAVRSWHGR